MTVRVLWKGAHPNNWESGHNRPIALVHHRMVGWLAGTTRYFASGEHRPVSTHFGVGPNEIHQYVDLSDIAYGNGNWDASGGWRLYNGRNPNLYTISIEHEDGATAQRGRVSETTIARSIELDRLLLSGDLIAMRRAGIHIRDPLTAKALAAIKPGPETLIDHHRIAGRLKPYCWRQWLDDKGFPQARYLAALKTVQEAPVATPVDLTNPSPDTIYLLRQYLQARKTPPASGFFHDNAATIESQIVQLVASFIAHGTAYVRKGAISVSVLKLARKLNAGNRFNLDPLFAKALETGDPEYAIANGVTSGRITA